MLLPFGDLLVVFLRYSEALALFPLRRTLDTAGAGLLADTVCQQAPSVTLDLLAGVQGPPIDHIPVFSGVLQCSDQPRKSQSLTQLR